MENQADSDHSMGGLGAGLTGPGRTTINLIRRAIEGGWNVPENVKKLSVDEMRMILLTSKSKRLKVAAVKALIAADANDLKFESINKPESAVNVNVQQNNVNGVTKEDDEADVERERAFVLGVIRSVRNNLGTTQATISGDNRSQTSPSLEPSAGPSN